MARIRSCHPEQWTDDDFVICSPLARLLALGVRNQADDNSIFEWNPVKLKMRVLPADNCDVAALLEELAGANQVWRFTVRGATFGMIRNFQRFQRPKYPTFQYPVPSEPLPNGYALSGSYSGSGGGIGKAEGEVLGKSSGKPAAGESSGEERREEHQRAPELALVAPAAAPSAPPFVLIPLKDGSEYPVTQGQVAEWKAAFPAVDIEQELREMRAWSLANEPKRKTRRGVERFVVGWLSKEKRTGHAGNGASSPGHLRPQGADL